MKRILFSMVFVLLLLGNVSAQDLTLRFSVTTAAYLPEYPDYDYNSPVYGIDAQFDLINFYHMYGFGGEVFYRFSSYHDYFEDMRFYELYLHNLFNRIDEESKFIYGFFAGARRTEIYFEDRVLGHNVDVMFVRPVIGFKYIGNNWGGIIRWTQNENNRSKFEYEFKLSNSSGFILQVGGSLKGPVKGVKSDFHIYAGYEFFI